MIQTGQVSCSGPPRKGLSWDANPEVSLKACFQSVLPSLRENFWRKGRTFTSLKGFDNQLPNACIFSWHWAFVEFRVPLWLYNSTLKHLHDLNSFVLLLPSLLVCCHPCVNKSDFQNHNLEEKKAQPSSLSSDLPLYSLYTLPQSGFSYIEPQMQQPRKISLL